MWEWVAAYNVREPRRTGNAVAQVAESLCGTDSWIAGSCRFLSEDPWALGVSLNAAVYGVSVGSWTPLVEQGRDGCSWTC